MRRGTTAVFVAMMAWLFYFGPGFGTASASGKKKEGFKLDDVELVKQNFHKLGTRALNKNIKDCLDIFHQFTAMSSYFDRADVALPGFKKLLQKYADIELGNARLMMEYMNKRGSAVDLKQIKKPKIHDWSDGISALKYVLKYQKFLSKRFHDTHKDIAVYTNDPHLKHFIEDNLIEQKIQMIKELGDQTTQLSRLLDNEYAGLGLYMFDKTL